MEYLGIAMKVSKVSIIVNVILSAAKLAAGIIGNSSAMISDAIHSASDVFSTFVVIAGVKMSNKLSDDEHQYGHERMECVASILLAAVLFIVGAKIGFSGIEKIMTANYGELQIPSVLPLIAAVVSIGVKEWMYWYTRHAAKKINSGALMADAWHHRSDALSSVGSFAGILGARLGFPVLDPVASVVISLFILKVSFDVFKDSVNKLVDTSCDAELVEDMKEMILTEEGVLGIDLIQTRIFGSKIYVDIEIKADGEQSLEDAHSIAERVHDIIESKFPAVKHCMVHVNPYNQLSPEE
ncbi:cation diffusion facilitator family transporter [Aminipila sp.]|jgi:cation diffusion facilitator family transporter|uniref:cation diffusion facilitator family transporter n=1 Tax=Aminipila sp. TaxID=2060095 RepID=UPI00289CE09D|nr:cation diffusion facilitator family transporter [Aminipila sp.]